ncbi:GNAT family N-acetyltransferase [Pseudoruegeria sp. SHC-113]|uniref:GNAT family N-acetyltransferase n=1 Tax=Pseudoruegeria sp. SHC-113 TaxID=2855439 RepID=UPI0021BABD4B|nr:GNAT family N-acetyltransferase [Pseudoruegeria sp. SHC-113]MCT8161800.1 GNAT family N-acetyltransferase [Pseudoruegeria sp. SHC-113]
MAVTREFRTLTADEVTLAVEWAAAEGWNPGLHDAQTFHAADPGAFVGCFVEGALAAVISVARHSAGFGFLGFYICRPDLRGRGHGLALWQAALPRLDGATVGLDGVVAQQENYRASGFAYAHANTRFAIGPTQLPEAPALDAVTARVDAVHGLDTEVTGFSRSTYLQAWLAQPEARSLMLMNGARCAGWGVARPCREGTKIGPLMADSPDLAETLFLSLASGAAGPVFLDVPMPNAAAAAMAERLGMEPVFETARMYRGRAPKEDLARLYGVMSFEFG